MTDQPAPTEDVVWVHAHAESNYSGIPDVDDYIAFPSSEWEAMTEAERNRELTDAAWAAMGRLGAPAAPLWSTPARSPTNGRTDPAVTATNIDLSKPLITGEAGVLLDAYDCLELLAAREDDWPARTLAAAARVVADLWNDPDPYVARMEVEKAWPELANAMRELLAGGPCHPPLTIAEVRNRADELKG